MNGTVLVTGGAGYIGSHTCKALSRAGYLPVAYDNLSQGHGWAVKWGPLIEGSLSDTARLAAAITEHQPVAVMHFAARLSVGESVSNPALYYRNNVSSTLDLLDTMRANSLNRIVFSSTAAVYGDPIQVPITENHPTAPTSPYGSTKLTVERMLVDFAGAYSMQSVALRYFNAAGADPDGMIGEAHDPETHLIPLVLEAATGKRPEIAIFGDDYDTPDGTCVRDYVHVTDLADAHVLALQRMERVQDSQAEAFNLGNGNGFSVREVVDAATIITGQDIPVTVSGRRAGDPPVLVADASLAKAELGWVPKYPSLREQIGHAWNWMQASTAA